MSAKSNKKLRYAIVGCGMISGAHLNALKHIEEAEVVGLCDLIISKAHDRAEEFGVAKEACYKDCKKMFKELKPDVVCVCTPNGQHMPVSVAASKAGCHVLVEKPMAMSPLECKKMIAAAKAANEKATQRETNHLPEDENEPLDRATQTNFLTSWEVLYCIVLPEP